ncbi:MAG: hypothetical protein ACJ0OL_03230 [Dehalococcoidia bacterium]
MSSQITCVWNVWRKGSDTFAEKLSFESKIEPRLGDNVYLKFSPPHWRIVDWVLESESAEEMVFKVWVMRTSN